MEAKETYLKGCDHCGATGFVKHYITGLAANSQFTNVCPVCNGSKTVLVTRTYEVPDITIPQSPVEQKQPQKKAEEIISNIKEIAEKPFITARFGDHWKEHIKKQLDVGSITIESIIDIAWRHGRRNILFEDFIMHEYANQILPSDKERKPSNKDIENAAHEYATQHGKGLYGDYLIAYKAGATECRDNEIYISPENTPSKRFNPNTPYLDNTQKPKECIECGKWNSENCNTCRVINPQYDGA